MSVMVAPFSWSYEVVLLGMTSPVTPVLAVMRDGAHGSALGSTDITWFSPVIVGPTLPF